MHDTTKPLTLGILLAALTAGCAAPPEGLARTEDGDGPEIIFDLHRRPLPELPFPNDIATRPDSTSSTGLRINASLVANTKLEQVARQRLDELTGFGVYGQISLRFDGPIDVEEIYERHRDHRTRTDGKDYSFDNDAVFLIDVTPGSPRFLEPVPLDFGEGNFPVLLRTPHQYWEHDPKTITKTLAFESHNEDTNGNGRLEPLEDIDLDGHLDRPNVHELEDGVPGLDPNRDVVSFYEFETNSLIFKPVLPLLEKTRYAVVVTKRLTDEDGDPVRSPFPYVNHAAQTDHLRPALETLDEYGLDEDDIAFAWTFTTQDATGDLVNLRNGSYGEGPLSWLAKDNPPELLSLFQMRDEMTPQGVTNDNVFILPSEDVQPLIEPLASFAFGGLGFGDIDADQLIANHTFYGYHVSGLFRSPRLIDLVEAENPDERVWPADLLDSSLRERIAYDEIQFWCAIPKKEFKADPNAPAPVVLYAHGYTSNKIEQLGLALHAKFGIAGCSIDAVGHGIDAGDSEATLVNFLRLLGLGPAADAFLYGRIQDVDGDGEGDLGAPMFSAYMFKTRDNLRQSLLDWMHLVRLLRTFGEGKMQDVNGDGVEEVLGDFDADGVADIGGENAVFFASGTSLGGLLSAMLSAIEPEVVASAPISGGAGLVDLTIRSEQGGVVEAVGLQLFGPLLIGERAADGRTRVYQLFVNGNREERRDIAIVDDIEPDDVVMVTNLNSGEARCARVMPNDPPPGYENYRGWDRTDNCSSNNSELCFQCADEDAGSYRCDLARTFRVGVPSDRGDPLVLEVYDDVESVQVTGDERDCEVVGDASPKLRVDQFDYAIDEYRGTAHAVGDDLVALESGYGFQRGTPLLRRFMTIAQIAIEGADPAIYAPHYSAVPLTFMEDGEEFTKRPTHVLNVATVGDPNVPINTGIAIAKVAGFVEVQDADPRYGKTVNRVLIDEGVTDGIPWLETRGPEWGPVLVDVDNLSVSTNAVPMDPAGSTDLGVAPRLDPPLRLVGPTPGADKGMSGLVLPMLNEFNGAHGFPPPGFADGFDMGQFMEHQIGWFFRTEGEEIRYDPCMHELDTCDFIPAPPSGQ